MDWQKVSTAQHS